MYKVLIVALALATPALAVLPLVLETTSTTAAGVSTVTASTTLLSASAATGLFVAVGIAKAIGVGLLARELASRSKRDVSGPSTLGKESSFSIISQLEPAQCYRRLVCDVATGKMPADESDNVILAPFEVIFSLFLILNKSESFANRPIHYRELQSRMLISLANLSTSWLPPRPVVNSNPSRSAN